MELKDFGYDLPPELIAQEPVEPRDHSRLLVLRRAGGPLEHRRFADLPVYLHPGDALVLNDTRVLPARLLGRKAGSGGRAELLLLRRLERDRWEVLCRPGRRLPPGTEVVFGEEGRALLRARLGPEVGDGVRLADFTCQGTFEAVLDTLGHVPLPPYITRRPQDPERYQTVYARAPGSAAAPTAGLHFTPELLDRVRAAGTEVVPLTLHVGLGTFRPVQAERVEEHRMHAEYYELPERSAAVLNRARAQGGRIVAVGTTVARTLETATTPGGTVQPGSGWTDIFIYPGYRWKAVDALVTNFHLPRSTLLMLVSAFAGRERVLQAYREAVDHGYRFYSFGDAMLML